jgi:GNAT superfamily N-acetyltransferase
MGSTDPLQFARLTPDHVPACVALSAEAGWNQTADDWSLFLRHGTVIGVPDGAEGQPAATGAVLPYPDHFAWISMVLVTAHRRRQRLGTRILEACCADVGRRGLTAVLDATPAGERVYRPLGFEPMLPLTRWQGAGAGQATSRAGIRIMTANDLAAVTALDAAVFGAHRAFLLQSLLARAPRLAFVTADRTGFALARSGRIATQIGPIVAADEGAAAALLGTALDAVIGPVFLDVLDRWALLRRHLETRRFTIQRPYLRMGLGRSAPFGDPALTFVIAGPEFG